MLGESIYQFIDYTNKALANMPSEPVYFVDYIYNGTEVNPMNILDIAELDNLWGKDMDESLVAVKDLKITKDMVTLMSPDKKPTLKITLPNKVTLIKFGSNQEEYEKFISEGFVKADFVGKCNKNEWNGWVTPQIFIEDYDITGQARYLF